MEKEKIKYIRTRIADRINTFDDSILTLFPPSEYIRMMDKYPAAHDYQYVSPEIKKYTDEVILKSNENILELYHQLILLDLMERNAESLFRRDIPESIKLLYKQNYQRIIDYIESAAAPSGFFLHRNDKFLKDLGVCAGRIIPAGACKINVDRISRRFLFKKDIKQLVRGLSYIVFKLHGLKPIYNMHTDSHDPSSIGDYTEEGFTRFFIRVSHLLKLNPEIKGIYCVGWLNDPQLAEVSPRLAYTLRIFTENGGVNFYIGPSQSAIENATFKSQTRRKLFEEGKYIPIEYMAIWRRKELIAWADRYIKSTGKMIGLYKLGDNKDIQYAIRIKEKLIGDISNYDGTLLNKFPTSDYIKWCDQFPAVHYYQYTSPEIKLLAQNIIEYSNETILGLYHQVVLLELIIHNTPIVVCGDLPESIKSLYLQAFRRIAENIESEAEPPQFYLYDNEKYFKVFGVCAMHLIPAGARKINVFKLPRRFLFRKGLKQFFDAGGFILFELKGFIPLYRMHLDSHDPNLLAKFNPEGHQELFLNVAGLLRKNKDIKGLFGIAWFYDPALSKINDRYNYLRKTVTDNGGKIFYVDSDQSAVDNAIAKSPTRKRLYEEGKYHPANYMLVWSRKRLIAWADSIIKSENRLARNP